MVGLRVAMLLRSCRLPVELVLCNLSGYGSAPFVEKSNRMFTFLCNGS
jgi:hypothetical protein